MTKFHLLYIIFVLRSSLHTFSLQSLCSAPFSTLLYNLFALNSSLQIVVQSLCSQPFSTISLLCTLLNSFLQPLCSQLFSTNFLLKRGLISWTIVRWLQEKTHRKIQRHNLISLETRNTRERD